MSLLNYGRIIGIPFAAAAAGFVTFVKSNAKALLTLRIKSALRSPREYAAPAGALAAFLGLYVVHNPQKSAWSASYSQKILLVVAAHCQRKSNNLL